MSVLRVEEACRIVLDCAQPLGLERVFLNEATGRVLGEDLISPRAMPPWDNSAMDGFALRAEDTRDASAETPVTLDVLGTVHAGDTPQVSVRPGGAVRIMTGAPVPEGTTGVIPIERTRLAEARVEVLSVVDDGAFIRRRGEDIQEGTVVVAAGTRLTPAGIGVAAALGHAHLRAHQRPRVAIISTGDEIAEVGTHVSDNEIYSSNSYGLIALCQASGALPTYIGIASDTRDALRTHLEAAASCDVVLTTGGVSMGERDFVCEVLDELGADIKFWKVAQRPGHPLMFGTLGRRRLVFGLPGNPVSTLVSFYQYVRPALLAMQGHTQIFAPRVQATMVGEEKTRGDRAYFVRGVLTYADGQYTVTSTGAQGSGILSSMVRANALIHVPADVQKLEDGDTVTVEIIDERFGWSRPLGRS